MISEKKEKQILLMSFMAGLIFAILEFLFSIYSHSQSALTDAVYDASELVFIALLLFLTPLFYKPVSEKHPYGYLQVESIFIIIKCVMMVSVSFSILMDVINSLLIGGNHVNSTQVTIFQLCLGILSLIIYLILKHLNKNISSPTINSELLGWRLDVYYSLSMSLAFFLSRYLYMTPLAFIAPYFDQIIAIFVMIFMLPDTIKILKDAIKDIFLFSPDEKITNEIKELSLPILNEFNFEAVFYDITKTGRHLWVAIYFKINDSNIELIKLKEAQEKITTLVDNEFNDITCELILVP